VGTPGYYEPDGTLTRYWNNAVDTSSIAGWAVQSRQVSAEWDVLVRGWVNSLGGACITGKALKMIFGIDRRVYQPVRAK